MKEKILSIFLVILSPSIAFAESAVVSLEKPTDNIIASQTSDTLKKDSTLSITQETNNTVTSGIDERTTADQEIYNQNIEEAKDVIEKDNKSIHDIKNINIDFKDIREDTKFFKKKPSDFSIQSSLYYVPILNSNFELGHNNWQELYQSYDGKWYDSNLIIQSGPGGYNDWYAYLNDRKWLISDSFKIPINTKDLYYEYQSRFVHWGTCSYGINGVQVVVYDNTNASVVGQIGFHNAATDAYDYDYYTYYNTLYNIQSRIGHELKIHYITYHDDPGCTFALYTDNIMLNVLRDDACINGNCKVYRFQNKITSGTYLFTADENEANSILANYSDKFLLEGVAYYVPTSGNPVYRFQNKITSGTYLFTADENEKNSVLANYADTYLLEGVAYYTPISGSPVYRFQNKLNNTFLFIADENEKNSVLANYANTFMLNGVAFYSLNNH